MKSEAEVRSALHDWIVRTSGKVQPSEVAHDTPILERRIVKSLDLMDLILFLEELRGSPIDVEKLRPGVFRNIDAIWKNFFEAA